MLVELITPEGTGYKGEAYAVTLPTIQGEITVLPHHLPIIATLGIGMMTLKSDDGEHYFAISRGIVEVGPCRVRVLSDIADRVDALDETAVEEAKKRAESLLKEKRHDTEGFAEATAVLDRELARLQSVRRRRTHRHLPT